MNSLSEVLRRTFAAPSEVTTDDLPTLRQLHLGGYLRPRLPQGHPLRGALKMDAVQLAARHALIKSEVRPLLQLWADAGVPALLFKGFALAEFDYATPAERFYGDVDLLLPNDPDLISRAVHLALAHGWRSDGQHASPATWTHECAHLVSPSGQAKLDVHRFVTAWEVGPQERMQALTRQMWASAVPTDWAGVPVLLPSPADRAVLTLAVSRCWGGDAGGLKPADVPDLQVLRERHRLTDEALAQRAQELGVSQTWAAFLRVCQPAGPELARALQGRLPVLLDAARRDGRDHRALLWRARLRSAPRRAVWMLRLLPDVYAAARVGRQGGDPRAALRPWGQPVSGRLSLSTQNDLIGAVNWWTRLLYPRQSRRGVCVPRATATYRALRRYGHPAVFVSGVARTPTGLTGHAWVEDDRGVMESYGEPLVRQRFTESFRVPE